MHCGDHGRSCTIFTEWTVTESHASVIYESNRCIVLAETLSPYRINPVKRIDESARRILYNHNKKELVVNNEIV